MSLHLVNYDNNIYYKYKFYSRTSAFWQFEKMSEKCTQFHKFLLAEKEKK